MRIFLLLFSFAIPAHAYFGARSQEARISFQGQLELTLNSRTDLRLLNKEGTAARKTALELIELQIRHQRGAMQSKYFQKKFPYRGIIGEDYSVRFLAIQPEPQRNNFFTLTYALEGKVILEKRFFSETKSSEHALPILMPLDPLNIYEKSKGNSRRNFCMPAGITSEDEFWYYWDLSFAGCSLLQDGKPSPLLYQTNAELEPLTETRKTCPQYSKLYSGSQLKISAFYGYVNSIKKHNHVNYRDPSIESMRGFEKQLEHWGFEKDKNRSFDRFSSNKRKGIAFHHIWLGSLTYKRKKLPVEVSVVLADTNADSSDETFHELIQPALRDSNIIIYDGHAGDDTHLNLSADGLGVKHLPRDLYQIFFFNACYTYPYYNRMYFDAKGSRDNIEIITTGQETDTSMSVRNMRDFLEPFLFPKNQPYQDIIETLESHIPKSVGTALYGVNGDEGKSCE